MCYVTAYVEGWFTVLTIFGEHHNAATVPVAAANHRHRERNTRSPRRSEPISSLALGGGLLEQGPASSHTHFAPSADGDLGCRRHQMDLLVLLTSFRLHRLHRRRLHVAVEQRGRGIAAYQ